MEKALSSLNLCSQQSQPCPSHLPWKDKRGQMGAVKWTGPKSWEALNTDSKILELHILHDVIVRTPCFKSPSGSRSYLDLAKGFKMTVPYWHGH